jgi:hypothetical protein
MNWFSNWETGSPKKGPVSTGHESLHLKRESVVSKDELVSSRDKLIHQKDEPVSK